MTDFPIHNESSAPVASQPYLAKARQAFGMVPNMLAMFAEAPALLEGYMTLAGIFERSSFTAIEQQVILLSVSFENRCSYCMAAHSTIARGQDVPPAVITALRAGLPPADARLGALAAFTWAVVRERGWVGEPQIARFLAAGFGRAQVLEVVLGVGLKTLSNYANHIAAPPVDEPFHPQVWHAPA